MRKIAIAIFVKTPGYSPIKTRLASDIGESGAAELYELSLKAIETTIKNVAAKNSDFVPYWAVAESDALENSHWSSFATIDQGEGNLGSRLSKVYSQLLNLFDAVIMIGADSPQLSSQTIIEASHALIDYNFVIGPALDGGFFLFAGKIPIDIELWERVPYSASTTAKTLTELLKNQGELYQLPSETDLDTATDLWPLINSLVQIDFISVPQQKLLEVASRYTKNFKLK